MQFVDGFPGRYVVIARQGNGHWYVAGINAQKSAIDLKLSFADLHVPGTATLITDGDGGNQSYREQVVRVADDGSLAITVRPRGGFVLRFD